jgi:GTP cyclohydrolase II
VWLLYLRGREERSIGLTRKVQAYALHDNDPDTVEAKEDLGLRIDFPNDAVAARCCLIVGALREACNCSFQRR